MAIIKVRDENGDVIDIPAIVGPPGADYVLTESDKAEIAELAAELVEVPEGGGADLDGYATEQYVKDYAQPKGNYLTEHQDISGKLDSNKLPEAINTALAQAKASGKFDGTNGTSATHSWNGTVLTITSASGTSSADLKGAKGDKGDSVKGDPGSDGVSPTVAVSKSGKVTTVSITDKNGTKTATITDGADGTPGKTPVKGTDYWTTADQEAIVQQVISALGTPVFGRVDEDCKITLIGELADGKTYTFAFVDEDGVETVIGTYTKSNAPDYTNQIAVSTDADGNVYNGTGYKVGYRLNSSGAEDALETTATNPAFITGFIPIKTGDVVLMKDCYIDTNNVDKTSTYGKPNWSLYTNYFASDRAHKIKTEWNNMLTSKFVKDLVLDAGGYCTGFTFTGEIGSNSIAYVRLCLAGTPETAVVTINEAIE